MICDFMGLIKCLVIVVWRFMFMVFVVFFVMMCRWKFGWMFLFVC